jgi:uracil-DNA glycosylase
MSYLPQFPEKWAQAIAPFLVKDFFEKMDSKLSSASKVIFPQREDIFRAFELTPFDKVRVVFVGQDPYHGENEACGLCFSIREGVRLPPSLKNMIKELKNDLNQALIDSTLEAWSRQGVLLLNRTLTVFKDEPLSHREWGWDLFMNAVVKALLAEKRPIIFVTLGKESEQLLKSYQEDFKNYHSHLNFTHPSPLSAYRGFFGSKMYSQINQQLIGLGLEAIIFGKEISSSCSMTAIASDEASV